MLMPLDAPITRERLLLLRAVADSHGYDVCRAAKGAAVAINASEAIGWARPFEVPVRLFAELAQALTAALTPWRDARCPRCGGALLYGGKTGWPVVGTAHCEHAAVMSDPPECLWPGGNAAQLDADYRVLVTPETTALTPRPQ